MNRRANVFLLPLLLFAFSATASSGNASLSLDKAYWASKQDDEFRRLGVQVRVRSERLVLALPKSLTGAELQQLHPRFCVDITPRLKQRSQLPFVTLSSNPQLLHPLPNRMLSSHGGRSCHSLDFGGARLPFVTEQRIRFEIVSGRIKYPLTLVLSSN